MNSKQNKLKEKQIKIEKTKKEIIQVITKVLIWIKVHLQTMLVIFLAFMIAIIPNIVYADVITLSPMERLNWITTSATYFDFFSYTKSVLLIRGSLVLLLGTIILVFLKQIKLKMKWYYLPLLIYMFVSIFSALFSKDNVITTRGFVEMHQGIWVLLSYTILIIIIPLIVNKKHHVWILISGFLVLGLIQFIIGGLQYFGYDPFKTEWGQLLMLPTIYEPLREVLEFKFPMFNIYTTMYNTNFVGSFAALMIPFAFGLYFYFKKWYFKLSFLVFTGMMIFIGYGSNSRAGILGILASLILIVILFFKSSIKKPLSMILPFLFVVTVGIVLNSVTEGKVAQELESMNLIRVIQSITEQKEETLLFKTIDTSNDQVLIETNFESIIIKKDLNGFQFETIEGITLETHFEDLTYSFIDETYQSFKLELIEAASNLYVLTAYNKRIILIEHQNGLNVFSSRAEAINPADVRYTPWMLGYERLFSGRVYIWSRSIPLLWDYVFLGAGPDMYVTVFPQDDYLGDLNGTGFSNVLVDKPHNMYLQMAINTGVISLIAMLTLWSWYIVESFKLYGFKELKSFESIMGVSVSLSVIAYLVTGMFNDQIVSVAPLFYILTGLGLAINQINLNKKKDGLK